MDLLNSAEAGRRLGYTKWHMARLARDGRLEASKLPGRNGSYVFDRAYIDALAKEKDDDGAL